MRATLAMSHIYYDQVVNPLSRNHSSVNRFIEHILCARTRQSPGESTGSKTKSFSEPYSLVMGRGTGKQAAHSHNQNIHH